MRGVLLAVCFVLSACGGGSERTSGEPSRTAASAPAGEPTQTQTERVPAPEAATPAPSASPAPPAPIAVWGDSLARAMTLQLQKIIGSRCVFNGGVGGQASTQIAARQGGVIPRLTVAGNTIPAAEPVSLIAQTVLTSTDRGPGPVKGTLGGVHGSVTYDAANVYSFTRTTPGEAVTIRPEEPFLVDIEGRNEWATVFWYGRNNYMDPEQVKQDLAASIARLAPGNDRFLVLAVLNGDFPQDIKGGAGYASIVRLNADLAATYPQNYIDVRTILVSQFDPTLPQDIADHNNDIVPASLRRDVIHLSAKGDILVATKIKEFFEAKGW